MSISTFPPSAIVALDTDSELNLASSTEATVATITGNGASRITKIAVSGQEAAKWTIERNSVVMETWYQYGTPSHDFVFNGGEDKDGLNLPVGDVIDVKVQHFRSGLTPNFFTTIYGK